MTKKKIRNPYLNHLLFIHRGTSFFRERPKRPPIRPKRGINVSTGVIVELSGTFDLTIHGERYCVLGEFWKEADGDQLLLRPGEDTIWYYAHEQDKVRRLCNDMTELLEKKLARYLNEH